MFKEYKISIAIIIGSIIIAFAIWYTQTYKDRAKYNFCIKSNSEDVAKEKLTQDLKDSIREYCNLTVYIQR